MAVKRITQKTTGRRFSTAKPVRVKEEKKGVMRSFRISESYTSLILGVFVVIISSLLLVSFLRNRDIGQINQTQKEISATSTKAEDTTQPTTYTVAAGDDLWKIAERTYKSGYNWVDIAKANNIVNPGDIKVGMKLTLPQVTPILIAQGATAQPTQQPEQPQPTVKPTTTISTATQSGQQSQPEQPVQNFGEQISGTTYKVIAGDHLWGIAVRAYGDGYKWSEIAKANNITTPGLIYPNTELKLPRG